MKTPFKIGLKISTKKMLKIVQILIIIMSCSGLVYITFFLYNNFYIALTESEIIISLRDKVAIETVNAKKFDNIIKNIDKKTAQKNSADIANLFK